MWGYVDAMQEQEEKEGRWEAEPSLQPLPPD